MSQNDLCLTDILGGGCSTETEVTYRSYQSASVESGLGWRKTWINFGWLLEPSFSE